MIKTFKELQIKLPNLFEKDCCYLHIKLLTFMANCDPNIRKEMREGDTHIMVGDFVGCKPKIA